MFTGLVERRVTVLEVEPRGQDSVIRVDLGEIAAGAGIGDSISLSGVCCTVATLEPPQASFVLSPETLRRTWFGDLCPGAELNVEDSLRAGEAMGGHIVQGHVDGVGEVTDPVSTEGGELWVRVPRDLLRYCVEKGSIAVDGISLTIAAVDDDRIMIAVIPHTAEITTLGTTKAGARVNLEVDILAKYVERLLQARG